jgi:Domain of unknown function (DUF4402)
MYMRSDTTIRHLITGISVVALLGSNAFAATQSVTASVAFDTPLTINKVADIEFGTVKGGVSGTYTINTGATISTGGSAVWLSGTPAAGNLSIVGSATQTIAISVGSYNADHGVTPGSATCAYNGGGAGACSLSGQAAPGGGKTLLLGVTATVDGSQAAGDTAAPTFVVTVVYS